MQDAQDFLSGKKAIRNQANKQRSDHPGDRADGVGVADVPRLEADRAEVVWRGDVPSPPDEELEEHHYGQFNADG